MSDDEIKERLFRIYALTGADTDGNTTFHCSLADAWEWTYIAVKELRLDYDEAINE